MQSLVPYVWYRHKQVLAWALQRALASLPCAYQCGKAGSSCEAQIASAEQKLVQLAEHHRLLEHLNAERKELANCCRRVYDKR
jgi:hypothetical protein